MGTRAGAGVVKIVLRNGTTADQLPFPDTRFLGVLGVYYGIIAQGSLQPEDPESRILVLPPPAAAPFLPSACNSGLTFCELGHLPSASYPTSHVRRLTHKLKRLRGSILLQPPVNNVTDSVVTDFLKRLKPSLQRPPGTGQSEPDAGSGVFGQGFQGHGMQGSRGQEGVGRPNTVTSGDNPSKPTHSSMEVDSGNTGEEIEVPLCSAQTRFVRPRAALNSNLEWRFIINLGDGSNSSWSGYEQVVKVEVCLSEGFSCDIVADGHQTVCRQKFTSHRWSLTKRQNVKKTAIRPFAGRSSTFTLHRLLALNGSGLEYLDTFL